MQKLFYSMVWVLCGGLLFGADWLTDGGNPQRTGWQKDEHILTRENVKNLKILWRVQLDNQPRQMHSLFPPLIVDGIQTKKGRRQIAIEAGVSDNIYAIDVETGKVIWRKHFEYPPITKGRGLDPTDPLCPGGQTATPVIGPPAGTGARTVYALAGNGMLHSLNVADGEDVSPPVQFGFPNGKLYSLNMRDGLIFTASSQSCNGNPNQVWAIDVHDPRHQVMTFNPGSGGLWGRSGASIDSTGTAWAPTGDGTYDPQTRMYGNGLIGVHVVGDQLKLKDWFEPRDWFWMQKRDLDMQVTPPVFNYKGKELLAVGSKACRVYLLDTADMGGDDHQTPLYQTPLMCNADVNFASAGIWGSMATWQEGKGTRWLLTPFWGAPRKDFDVPVTHGPVTHGAVVALKVEGENGHYRLTPAWMSQDMDRAEPPVVANNVIFAYGSGEYTEQAYSDIGLFDNSPRRIARSTHAVLYALDADTGKTLYSSGDQITSFNHFSGLSVANGRVYIATYDSVLYCFGLDESRGGSAEKLARVDR